MKLAAALLLLASPAFAQPPTEVVPPGDYSLAVGQVKVLKFDENIAQVSVATKGTIEATAQSDRQITIAGVAVGETQIYFFDANNKSIYAATVTVTSEKGHLVKIYGSGKNDDVNAGYTAMYCNEFSCGRPDKDLPVPQVTVERVSRTRKDIQ